MGPLRVCEEDTASSGPWWLLASFEQIRGPPASSARWGSEQPDCRPLLPCSRDGVRGQRCPDPTARSSPTLPRAGAFPAPPAPLAGRCGERRE